MVPYSGSQTMPQSLVKMLLHLKNDTFGIEDCFRSCAPSELF